MSSAISKATTVQLDVGGTPYKVSLSLIENFPDSMLASIVSGKWKENSEEEIFIERNGHRFQYVLDYMRDGEVTLPKGECVKSLYKELDYFGIEYDSTKISSFDSLNLPDSRNSYRRFFEKYCTLEKEQGDECKTTMIKVDIIRAALGRFTSNSIDFSISYSCDSKTNPRSTSEIFQFLNAKSSDSRNEIVERINECIVDLNLKIVRTNFATGNKHTLTIGRASYA